MIPPAESDAIVVTLSDALALGNAARAARGYLILRAGLDAALRSQTPHAAELVVEWRAAMRHFKSRYPREWYDPDRA